MKRKGILTADTHAIVFVAPVNLARRIALCFAVSGWDGAHDAVEEIWNLSGRRGGKEEEECGE
jgi:hypothetical protein